MNFWRKKRKISECDGDAESNGILTDRELCPICSNPERDQRTIMVVETPRDLAAYEKTGKYNGAPAVKDAVSRGIKVISVDRGVNGVDVDCAIASDNVEGAKMATEYMVSLLGENAKVAELEGVSGASATIERGKGFHLVADEKLDVVSKQTANFNRSEGMSVMENMLQANSAIQGVFAHNDEMALGAVEAVGNKKILVVGFDATDDAVAAVKAGKMAATVAQKPNLMGETAVETAIQILQGETVEKTIPVEVELITKDTAQ